MPDELNHGAAILTAVFSPTTLATATPVPTAPTTPPAAPVVEPHSKAGVSDTEAAKMAAWTREDLAAGKISRSQADKIFSELNVPAEPRAPDVRTDEVKQLDADFPPARPEDFIIRYYTPGEEPPAMPKEVQAFDANARRWMADAGLSREIGNSLVTTISKMIQQTHTLSANERETYKDNENAKLDNLFGPDWHDQLQPASRMIDELDRKRPGLKDFVRAHGDNALFVTQLIQAARIYDARKGR